MACDPAERYPQGHAGSVGRGPGRRGSGLRRPGVAGRGVHVNVVAVRRDGKTQLSPAEGETLRAGDRIVVVGDKENLGRLATLAQGSKAAEAST